MKYWLTFVLLASALTSCLAATAMGFYNDPKHPGKCTISEDLILSPGDIRKHPSMTCGRIICGDGGLVNFHTCPAMGVSPNCVIGDYVDLTRDYPGCCERKIECS